MLIRHLLPLWLALFIATDASSAPASQTLGMHLVNCTAGTGKIPARCGTFVVYENRAVQRGRTIAIPLKVLLAKHRTDRAIFWNPGGPGASAANLADLIADGTIAKELTALLDRYDIVLANNRGAGGPNEQQCDVAPRDHPEYYFLQIWPDALVKACRKRLAAEADLNLYTSSISADDLDDMRKALGYPKIVLDGVSYGTYFFLVYMRQHSDHVESAVLDGVAPPGFLRIPLQTAAGAQLAMDRLLAACAADSDCHSRYPELPAHFVEVLRRFEAGPLAMGFQNSLSKQSRTVMLSKEVFVESLRFTLYDAPSAAYVPYVLEQAYAGDYAPLGRLVDKTARYFVGIMDFGLNLSVTCAEDLPFITEQEVRQEAAASFEGDLRVRAQQRACRIWSVHPVSTSFNEPVRSNAPALLVTGTDDPASPPSYAAAELPYLPNARQVLIKGAGHVEQSECVDRLKVAFVLAGSARDLDVASCVGSFHRPRFATSMNGFGDGRW